MTNTHKTNVHIFHAPRGCLSYLAFSGGKGALIDPSVEMIEEYKKTLDGERIELLYILETHTHADHVSAARDLQALYGGRIVMHEKSPSQHKDIGVHDGQVLHLNGTVIRVLYTPGHTNESVTYHIGNALYTGDALLIGGTGRTDFQLGSSEDLYHSLWEKLMTFPDETVVYPAHDYKGRTQSTIGMEKSNNPRLQMSHEEFVEHMNAHHPPKPELFDEAIAKNSE